MPKLIIAIDGYSSTGKGTFAKEIAKRLGLIYLDSGAMYRAITLYALQKDIIEWNGDIDFHTLHEHLILGNVEISFHHSKEGDDRIFLGSENVTEKIREMQVASNVSAISALPFVRNFVDSELHRIGSNGCVIDGRDIGTAVFPNADLKIFMTADAEIRANRRLLQLKEKGEIVTYEEILKNVQNRDYSDSHRTLHPLCKADDALVLDNSNMTVEDELAWFNGIIKKKFNLEIL